MDTIAVFFEIVRVVFNLLLLFFIPGFALSLVLFPRSTDLSSIDRLVYSIVLSISSSIVLVVFMDIVLGSLVTLENITLVVGVFSVILLVCWACEGWYLNSQAKKHQKLHSHVLSEDNLKDLENKIMVGTIRKLQKDILRDQDMFGITPESFKRSRKNIENIQIPQNSDIDKILADAHEEMKDLNWLFES
jgi:hypothetical protein